MESAGIKWLKLPVGDTLIRPLPPHPGMVNKETGAAPFYIHTSLHFGLPGRKFPEVCPRKMTGGALSCPICDYAFALKDAGHEKAGNALLPSWQAYMNVIVIDPNTGEPTRTKAGEIQVYVWSCGRGTLDKIFAKVERYEKKAGHKIDITDPEEGFVIEVNRKGTDMENTKYDVFLADEPSSIMDYIEVWGPGMVDVSKISKLRPAAELQALLTGGSAGPDPFETKSVEAPVAKKRLSFSRESDDEEPTEGEYRALPEDEPVADGEPAVESDAATRLKAMMDKGKKPAAEKAA